MTEIEKLPSDKDMKGIFADAYTLFVKYKDADVVENSEAINAEAAAIEEKYPFNAAKQMNELVCRTLIDRTRERRETKGWTI